MAAARRAEVIVLGLDNRPERVHLVIPLLLLLSLAVLKAIAPRVYDGLVVEDGVVEWATAGAYVVAFVVALGLARRHAARHRWWSAFILLLSLAFLFIALEEISWGQRILRLDTPRFFEERNVQREIGFHNLSVFRLWLSPAYIAIGFGGAFASVALSWLGVPDRARRQLVPPPHLFLYFVPCALFYLAAEIISPLTTARYMEEPDAVAAAIYGGRIDDPRGILALPAHALDLIRDVLPTKSFRSGARTAFWRHQEPVELLLSLGFLFFVRSWRGVTSDHTSAVA